MKTIPSPQHLSAKSFKLFFCLVCVVIWTLFFTSLLSVPMNLFLLLLHDLKIDVPRNWNIPFFRQMPQTIPLRVPPLLSQASSGRRLCYRWVVAVFACQVWLLFCRRSICVYIVFYLDCLCLPAFSPRVFICCNPRRRLYWNRGGWREGESDREIGRDGEKGKRVDRKVEREWERYRECVSGHIFSCISCTLACLSVCL